ncbi:hypothetical protein GS534_24195 [Rhodococcus hoagii]|nr:hypothetical protein [Prescottella equi]
MSTPTPAPDTPQGQMTPAQQTAAAIAAQAQQRAQVASLAEALIPQTQPGAIVGKAKVLSAEDGLPPTVTIQLGGDTSTSISAVRYIDSYTPVPGDTVIVVKQGSELFVLGQMMEKPVQPLNAGWQTPSSLGSGWGSNGFDPIRFRLVNEHGSYKVQFRGRIDRSSGGTATVFTLPVGYRPFASVNLLAARDDPGGSNAVGVQVQNSGAVVLVGTTATGMATGSTANPPTTNQDGSHWTGPDFANDVAPPATIPAGRHGHLVQDHKHIIPAGGGSHTHAVIFPNWVSLNGVEFFL